MNTPIEHVAIDAIVVGDRLRSDYGDIAGLAESIESNGLYHPLIVDDDLRLISGGRRLAAMKRLDFLEVPVRRWNALDESERQMHELEENIRRKDLTEIERSRELVALVETAREVDEKSGCTESVQPENPRPQNQPKPGSLRRVSERIGVPVQTIRDSEKHVAIMDEFPSIGFVPKDAAVKMATKLNAMEPDERAAVAEKIHNNDLHTITSLADMPPPLEPEGKEVSDRRRAAFNFRKNLTNIASTLASMTRHGGMAAISSEWEVADQEAVLHIMKQLNESMTDQITDLENAINGRKTNEPLPLFGDHQEFAMGQH